MFKNLNLLPGAPVPSKVSRSSTGSSIYRGSAQEHGLSRLIGRCEEKNEDKLGVSFLTNRNLFKILTLRRGTNRLSMRRHLSLLKRWKAIVQNRVPVLVATFQDRELVSWTTCGITPKDRDAWCLHGSLWPGARYDWRYHMIIVCSVVVLSMIDRRIGI